MPSKLSECESLIQTIHDQARIIEIADKTLELLENKFATLGGTLAQYRQQMADTIQVRTKLQQMANKQTQIDSEANIEKNIEVNPADSTPNPKESNVQFEIPPTWKRKKT